MSTVDIDFSKQRGTPNSREFRSIRRKVTWHSGENPLWIDARTFARTKNLIWDQLLATEAEII